MVISKIIRSVRTELMSVHFKIDDIFVLRVEEDRIVLNASRLDESYLIEYYQDGCSYLVDRYNEFTKYGIDMVEIVGFTDKIIIYSDINNISEYVRIGKEDLNDKNILISIANLYKKLGCIKDCVLFDYNEKFNLECIKYIMKKFKWETDKSFSYIHDNFGNIKLKLNRLEKGIIIKDLVLENLVFSKKNKNVLLYDLVNLEKSYLYKSIEDVTQLLDKENSKFFIGQFEGFGEGDEIMSFVVRSVVELYRYALGEVDYDNITKYVDRVSSGELFDCCKRLVEWY